MGILKKVKPTAYAALLTGALVMSCTMPDTFNRIDANKLRVIGVVIGPRPEVAPADTVTATAYFGGNKVTSISDINCAHRYGWAADGVVITDKYQVTPLGPIVGLPDSAVFSFIVKRDVFQGKQTYGNFAQSTVDSLSRLFAQPKDSVTAMISTLIDSQKTSLAAIVDKMVLPAQLLFTAHAENGAALTVSAQFTIKYHVGLSGVKPPNNNPDISWVGVCKVPDRDAYGFNFFDPGSSGKFTMTYLFNKTDPTLCDSVVDVDNGYAYFLVSDNGITTNMYPAGGARVDTTRDAIIGKSGEKIWETYGYKWFYQNVNNITDQDDSLMQIDKSDSACIEMKPPFNTAMKNFRVWVAAYDQIDGDWSRPRGMCVRGVKGVFRYSPGYVKRMNGN